MKISMPCICLPKLTIVFSTLRLISYNGYNTLVLLSHWGKNWGSTWLFLFILLQTHKEGGDSQWFWLSIIIITPLNYSDVYLEKKESHDNIWQQYNIIMLSTKMKILYHNSQLYSAF